MQTGRVAGTPLRVGIISLNWLPHYGGATIYAHRLSVALQKNGFVVSVFCSEEAQCDVDHEDVLVTRWFSKGEADCDGWKNAALNNDVEAQEYNWLYEFMDGAVSWAVAAGLEVVLVNSPLSNPKFHQARELYKQLKAHGIRVGTIQHDLVGDLRKALVRVYSQERDWERVADIVTNAMRETVRKAEPADGHSLIGSALFFSPDFVLCSSEWTSRFVDPFETVPRFVLHPLIEAEYWTSLPEASAVLERKSILMVNPIPHKGRNLMAGLIRGALPAWTFRVLRGGYGNAFQAFRPMVEMSDAVSKGRVEFLDYVQDMRAAYGAAEVVFFPSLYEGYGMTAVEPMFVGTPVVASNYPAITEAVGAGGCVLCPFRSSPQEWHAAVVDVLARPDFWKEKGMERAHELSARSRDELSRFVKFLRALA